MSANQAGLRIGDTIRITYMEGEPQMTGRVGKVTRIDSMGQVQGTWGIAMHPDTDTYETVADEH